MAVKKAATPKTGTKKAETTKKAAPKKAAPKKATPKKAAPEKAISPATAKAKPAGAKKAPAIKVSDAQTRVLGAVQQSGETGYAAGKGEGKILESLLTKKLVKRGKKVDGVARFLMTKAGSKHVSTAAAPVAPAPSPAVEAPAAPRPRPPSEVTIHSGSCPGMPARPSRGRGHPGGSRHPARTSLSRSSRPVAASSPALRPLPFFRGP